MKKMNRRKAIGIILGAMAAGTTTAVAGMDGCGSKMKKRAKCGVKMKDENSTMDMMGMKGEGKCGSKMKDAKCGGKMKSEMKGKCGAGKCGSEMKKMKKKKKAEMKGKCGAGKCGGSMK